MAEPGNPPVPPLTAPPQAGPQQLPLPGVPQPAMLLQGRFVAAAQYVSTLLQVCSHLFPDRPFFQLSPEQRRILANETNYLLLQARWTIESKWYAEHFAQQQPGVEMAPPGTILGERPGTPTAGAASTGQYL